MLLVRIFFSTCLVLGLIWYIARAMRQPKGLLSKFCQPFAGALVENRSAINRTTTVAVIRFGGQRLLVAANDNAVSLLATTDAADDTTHDSLEITEDRRPEVEPSEIAAVEQLLKRPSVLESLRGMTVRTSVGQK